MMMMTNNQIRSSSNKIELKAFAPVSAEVSELHIAYLKDAAVGMKHEVWEITDNISIIFYPLNNWLWQAADWTRKHNNITEIRCGTVWFFGKRSINI